MAAAPDTQAPAAPLVPARWFDGLRSQARPVLVGLRPAPGGPTLVLHTLQQPGAAPRAFAHRDVGWPEAWSHRRPQERLAVDLRDAGSLEIDDAPAWQAALAAAGQRPGLAQRMQTRWGILATVLLLSVVGLFFFYRHGTPWLATQLTRHVPLAWELALSNNALQQMDSGTLKPSKLAPERQAELRARFDALLAQSPARLQRYDGYAPRYTLAFRSGMAPNAFALPGGAVVMTDALVEAAQEHRLGDDALVGVLAHEIGHVAHRHTTRMLVEQGVLNIGLGLALGDVSGLLSTGGSLLTGLAYRRNHEREADCHAIALMQHARLPTAPMGALLQAIAHDGDGDGSDGHRHKGPKGPGEQKGQEPAEKEDLWSLLSSHPDTAARARALRAGQAPHCAR